MPCKIPVIGREGKASDGSLSGGLWEFFPIHLAGKHFGDEIVSRTYRHGKSSALTQYSRHGLHRGVETFYGLVKEKKTALHILLHSEKSGWRHEHLSTPALPLPQSPLHVIWIGPLQRIQMHCRCCQNKFSWDKEVSPQSRGQVQ